MDTGTVLKLGIQLFVVFLIEVFLVFPFVLSGANRLINRFWSPYWRTVGTVVLTGIAALIVNFIVNRIAGTRNPWVLGVVGVITTAVVGGAIMNAMVRHKDGEPIGYSRALLACLVLGIVVTLIGAATAPWTKSIGEKMKAAAPTPAAASSAPATASSAPALGSSVARAATAAPATSAALPATTASVPAAAASAQ